MAGTGPVGVCVDPDMALCSCGCEQQPRTCTTPGMCNIHGASHTDGTQPTIYYVASVLTHMHSAIRGQYQHGAGHGTAYLGVASHRHPTPCWLMLHQPPASTATGRPYLMQGLSRVVWRSALKSPQNRPKNRLSWQGVWGVPGGPGQNTPCFDPI